MNDAIIYTHEIEYLCDLLNEICEKSHEVIEEISFNGAIRSDYGAKKILMRTKQDYTPYTRNFISGLNRDVLDDLLFFVTGLTYIMENANEDNL